MQHRGNLAQHFNKIAGRNPLPPCLCTPNMPPACDVQAEFGCLHCDGFKSASSTQSATPVRRGLHTALLQHEAPHQTKLHVLVTRSRKPCVQSQPLLLSACGKRFDGGAQVGILIFQPPSACSRHHEPLQEECLRTGMHCKTSNMRHVNLLCAACSPKPLDTHVVTFFIVINLAQIVHQTPTLQRLQQRLAS